MKNLNIRVAIIILVLAVFLAGGSIYLAVNDANRTSNNQATTQDVQSGAQLTISGDGKTVSYAGQEGKTALEILNSLGDITAQQSSYGEFVIGINGVEANGTSQFWAFYVNGKLANEGAGTYKTTDTDQIEWKIEDVQ